MVADPIKVTGLAEFNRSLRALDRELPKGLRLANNEAAQIVVDWARARMPKRSGHAVSTVKASSTRTAARVSEGSKKYPYVPWLDYGGRVGPKGSVHRPFIKGGRYLYPGYTENKDKIEGVLQAALVKVAREAGLEVNP